MLDVNLSGAFFCARRALRKMVRAHAGRIVFVSSVGAFVGLPGQANYAASKAGLVGPRPGPRPRGRLEGHHGQRRGAGPRRHRHDSAPSATTASPARRPGAARPASRRQRRSPASWGSSPPPAAAYVTGAVLPLDGGLSMGL